MAIVILMCPSPDGYCILILLGYELMQEWFTLKTNISIASFVSAAHPW